MGVYDELKKKHRIFGHNRNNCEQVLSKLKPDEIAIAITSDNETQSLVCITNKRILLRKTQGILGVGKDQTINYNDIVEETIKTYGFSKMVHFKTYEKEFIFYNTQNNPFHQALINQVHMYKSRPENIESDDFVGKLVGLQHVDGISFVGNKRLNLELYEDRLDFVDFNEKKSYKILLKNILDVKIKKQTDISEQERDVFLRAIAGGAITGFVLGDLGVGSVVGGLTGVPHKIVKENAYFLSLDYLSKENEKKHILCLKEKNAPLNELENFLIHLINQIQKVKPFGIDEKGEIEL